MSGPFDHGMNMPLPNMMGASFPVFNGNFPAAYPRLSGPPPTHFDGSAFWYNPNNAEQTYDRDAGVFGGRGVPFPSTAMESSSVKHRRTRSGCFTCRSRRVKCDETRPICDRCKKGNRECEFPQPTTSSKRSKHGESRSPKDPTVKHETKHDNMSGLATIKDEGEDYDDDDDNSWKSPTERPPLSRLRTDSAQSIRQTSKSNHILGGSTMGKEHTSPQSTEASDTRSRDETPASSLRTVANSAEMQARHAKIKTLKPDLQKYLQFQQEYMTYYHYFFKLDPTDFVHSEFIDLALGYEPLLYAAVGFAAYHYELQQPDPKLSHFLGYHSKSLSMLRKSLESNAKITEATLLTVLQLATFEEYIGDWVNLVGHHRAACTMIRELFTSHSMMETDLGRRIFSWYARLDVTVGLMAGKVTRLDREWFEANSTWYYNQINNDPDGDLDIENTLAYFVAANRLIGMDLAVLFAQFRQHRDGQEATFRAEVGKVVERLESMKREIELFNDEYYRIQEFPVEKIRPLTPDDIVNPYAPGGLFKDVLWPLNFMWIDWYSIEQMQKYQMALLLKEPIPPEVEQLSLEQYRIIEAIDRWPEAPNGAILGAHASLGLSSVFLKRDPRYIMWARKKFATVERLGYIYPPSFRRNMAMLWGLTREEVGENESVENWWLPNDEGNLPMLKDLRRVVQERHENDDQMSSGMESLENVRDLKAIFAKLDIRTQGPPDSASMTDNRSPTSEGTPGMSDRGSHANFSPTNVNFGHDHGGNIPVQMNAGYGPMLQRAYTKP
ncbi:hypothetical protein ABEF92_005585 [Exophiala dermatitidis]|uniref:Zn(2)-C6 fungal-type domain-containing protein n=1 Tax=Exophiala dermatitidis (strain ATCC 34100 / CBS 525.76 / NIH/UT8656) TaxID=858893 RepID=H6BM31_EXODN|nr:uncharacterized protein HMPREF1120_01168 [Exophiala dermatitidis NIH/UT8656]EHY52967.1 hypothetical protein HMPREF1120_01168 [Exophiala dermatitidis NIH/UT8656]